MYAEFEDDPKVQMMPEPMQRRLIMLFCSRCKEAKLTDAQRAFKWHVSVAEIVETKNLFLEQGFIDEHWNPLAWNRRQFLSDSSTERVRRHRQAVKQDETLPKQDVPVAVTAPDTETDTEQKQNHKKHLPKGKPPADERHSIFRKDFEDDFKYLNKVSAPWDGKEAMRLSSWLKANPTITPELWRDILRHRRSSPINHSSSLSVWIGRAISWLNGPANEWGQANLQPANGATNGKNTNSLTDEQLAAARAKAETARSSGNRVQAG